MVPLAEMMKMENEMITTIILALFLSLGLAAKKKPVFGQMTLTGEMALDWLKSGSEITAGKIMMGAIGAFPEYNVPEWANDRNKDIAIIEHANVNLNPLLVTQKSVMRAIEAKCVEWEEEGAEVALEKSGSATRAVLIFGEDQPTFKFERSKNGGKFAPYIMYVEE